ncbi:MAG: M48 family metalloprotease, partial [Tenericutes bacterium]|nr:M48 family metalloprotease [Mycoplasmatota bacterium]
MRKKSFIVLNLLATITEISLILWLIISVLIDNPVFGIISLVVYLIFVITMFRVSLYKKTIFNTLDFPKELENSVNKIVNDFKQCYPNRDVSIYYAKDDSFIEPAAYLDNKIYVNGNYRFSDMFFKGIIAHELGHAQSELVKYKWINLLRISSILARQIFAFRFRKRKWFKTKIMKIMDFILIIIYNILNIFDHFVSNPFFRADEIYANEIAAKIGYGDSLRCFYFNSIIATPKEVKYISKYYDYKHPSVSKMLQRLESKMDLDEAEKDIYSVNNKIFKIKNAEESKIRNQRIMNWYLFKAKQNIDSILHEIGMIFLKGKYRNAVDKQTASEYFNKAKALNYLPSIYQLALLKYDSDSTDKVTMFHEFKHLADSKYEKAFIYLALCYGYGLGTEINGDLA